MGKDLRYRLLSKKNFEDDEPWYSQSDDKRNEDWINLAICSRHLNSVSFRGSWNFFRENLKRAIDNNHWDTITIFSAVLNDTACGKSFFNYIEIDYS
jgi:hypothetical protein